MPAGRLDTRGLVRKWQMTFGDDDAPRVELHKNIRTVGGMGLRRADKQETEQRPGAFCRDLQFPCFRAKATFKLPRHPFFKQGVRWNAQFRPDLCVIKSHMPPLLNGPSAILQDFDVQFASPDIEDFNHYGTAEWIKDHLV